MSRIIPVLDIRGGLAVHARGGHRDDYAPLRSTLRPGSAPIALAEAVRDTFAIGDLYLADLDAIAGLSPSFELYRELAALGLTIWVDAGLRDRSNAREILATGVARVVVGLETVAGPAGLRDVIEAVGSTRVVFSLDLRDGRPIGSRWPDDDPHRIASEAIACGVDTMILLDLGRVGTGQGTGTLPLLRRLSTEFPRVTWVAGGGVSGPSDLEEIDHAGGSAALVGSALHDGRL